MIDFIAFDADDTLWYSEVLYVNAQDQYTRLMAPYRPAGVVERELHETEMRNLPVFGYGVKGFLLSMIETAIRLSDGALTGREVQSIIDLGREMLETPIKLFDHVEATLETLSRSHELMLITKGDLLDQEAKLERSGLAGYFSRVEIVSDKTPRAYRAILAKHGIAPERFLMVGNSLRSDVLPVSAIGAHAVYIPYHLTWSHENDVGQRGEGLDYLTVEHIGELPGLLELLNGGQ